MPERLQCRTGVTRSKSAQMVLVAEEIVQDFGGLATVDRFGNDAPQSTNCITNGVHFHLDLRHHDDATLDRMETTIRTRFTEVTSRLVGVELAGYKALTGTPSIVFDLLAVSCVRDACKAYSADALVSGAGHYS